MIHLLLKMLSRFIYAIEWLLSGCRTPDYELV